MRWWRLLLGLAACTPPAEGPNVLLVVLDDVGIDKVGLYGTHADPPPTPNLDDLAAHGVRFANAYADPYCSPSRAGLLTGRHGLHYGIGTYLTTRSGWWLPQRETTLPEALRGYDSAAVGKTHIGGPKDGRPNGAFAVDQGFGHYEGAPDNLMGGELQDGLPEDYFHYDRLHGDRWDIVERYATTDVTDTAIEEMHRLGEPWFLWVGYHAAHRPWHVPPDPLNPLGAEEGDADPVLYDAMVHSLDLELGRLLDAMDERTRERTLIVVMSDNGTPEPAKTGPEAGLPGKGTVFEGGMHVPWIVAGGPVTDEGAVSEALINHVDLFATVLALTDVEADIPDDSVSFVPLLRDASAPHDRDHAYAEVFEPRGPGPHDERYDRAVRGERYKLIRTLDRPDRLFDLQTDPTERADLLAAGSLAPDAASALDHLEEWMADYEALGD